MSDFNYHIMTSIYISHMKLKYISKNDKAYYFEILGNIDDLLELKNKNINFIFPFFKTQKKNKYILRVKKKYMNGEALYQDKVSYYSFNITQYEYDDNEGFYVSSIAEENK